MSGQASPVQKARPGLCLHTPWGVEGSAHPRSPCAGSGGLCLPGALLLAVPVPLHMLSHLCRLFVWESVAQQSEPCLVAHRRPPALGLRLHCRSLSELGVGQQQPGACLLVE